MVKPYLPDIIQGCVSRINTSFSTRLKDPFNVFFDKGIVQQVRRSVYKADENFPLVWFVMKFDENYGTDFSINSEATFQIILAMPTETSYTQQEREDISFKPRLIPMYNQLMAEMQREKWFVTVGENSIRHNRQLLPYWGMADVEGVDVPNLFKNKFIDAISVTISGLKIKRKNCAVGSYSIIDTNIYPISTHSLIHFDDIELIVDGGESYDPVSGASSVIIPQLIGKDYEVVQRSFGQMRRRRNIEIIQNTVNGGFSLQGGFTFTNADTYFIKIRPQYK